MKKAPRPSAPPTKVSDDTLRQFIGYHMKRAFNVIQADLVEVLRRYDLRMVTYTALVLIVDNPGLSQSQLATAMDIERPNLVVIIDELEQRGLITRERVPTDRRLYALKATLAGRRLCDKAVATVVAHEARLFAEIDEDQRRVLHQALSHIHKARSV